MKILELIENKNGKLSPTRLMFLVWMLYLMAFAGYVTVSQKKLSDISEPYVYITCILCGTYTARQYLDGKLGLTTTTMTTSTGTTTVVTAPSTTSAVSGSLG